MFSAIALTPLQVFTAVSACSSIVVLHLLDRPLLHCPWWGFQLRACFSVAEDCLLSVCLIHFPFLYCDFHCLFFGYNTSSFEWTGKCVNALFCTLLYGL